MVTPPLSAVVIPRVFDDCPLSVLSTTNIFPSRINIADDRGAVACGGFANLHVWRFSIDGVNPMVFNNGDAFTVVADLVLNGAGEAGLQIAPWWSQSDGRFNVRSTDGEIACFGGRLPFFSFTGTHGLHYAAGELIHLEIAYDPNGLSQLSPGTIQYNLATRAWTTRAECSPSTRGIRTRIRPTDSGEFSMTPAWAAIPRCCGNRGTVRTPTFTNIQLLTPLTVAIDVKPGSCENPIGVNSQGTVPVAILGSVDLDVTQVDVSSVRLEGVAAKKSSIEDVEATTSACESCTPLGADGYPDLILKFSIPALLDALWSALRGKRGTASDRVPPERRFHRGSGLRRPRGQCP